MTSEDDAPAVGGGEGASEGGGGAPPTLEGETADPSVDGEVEGAAGTTDSGVESEASPPTDDGPRVAVGEYIWADFLAEHGHEDDVESLYRGYDPRAQRTDDEADGASGRWDDSESVEIPTPTQADWENVSVDPETHLEFHPVEAAETVETAAERAVELSADFEAFCDPSTTPVVKDEWLWEHYKREYYYEDDGSRPRDAEGEIEPFDEAAALGFDPDVIENALARGGQRAGELAEIVDERTVDVDPEFDEDAFFSDARGATTVVNRYDLEKAVPLAKKTHFREVERYWVNEPHSFVIIFHSEKENEKKYYVIEPYQTRIETDLSEFLTGKLRTAIKYGDEDVVDDAPGTRRRTIERQALELLERYNLYQAPENPREAGISVLAPEPSELGEADEGGLLSGLDLDFGSGDGTDDEPAPNRSERRLGAIARSLGLEPGSFGGRFDEWLGTADAEDVDHSLDGIAARPEPAVLAEDSAELNDYQVEKLLYALRRDFIGYERIDGIKHDVNVEDISCDGYNSRVFVYHSDYEQIISNVEHGEEELDDFVVKLAQRSGKGISKRRPQVDATLPDGSRAQLTLGREVSDHGTNYTIRQFKDVPFTPVDLVNWKTFSLEEMAFLWLCIENDKSLIFAGGTASGKTTSLNAVSLFIPSNSKIVSIEDTREVELPQRNWVASVTRPSFSDDDQGDVDEFDLLEAALRQRPDYIVMGEIRGEEGRTLFQVMSTGHTTYTTFHADSVGEVLKRFTTDPINVSKTMFTALDLVSIQTSTRVQGNKVRRNKSLTEINHYDAENDEINVQDVYQWQAEGDEFLKMGSSNTLDDIRFDRGWTHEELDDELFKRRVVLAYLIDRDLNTYTQVAATLQAFINDQETILALMARDELERSLEDLREMESVQIDVDPEKEEMVPRPSANEEGLELCREILAEAEEELWPKYGDLEDVDVADALVDVESAPDVEATGGERHELDALEERIDDPALDAGSESPGDSESEPPSLSGPDAEAPDGTEASDTTEASGDEAPDATEAADDGRDGFGSPDETGSADEFDTVADEADDDGGPIVWGADGVDEADDGPTDVDLFDNYDGGSSDEGTRFIGSDDGSQFDESDDDARTIGSDDADDDFRIGGPNDADDEGGLYSGRSADDPSSDDGTEPDDDDQDPFADAPDSSAEPDDASDALGSLGGETDSAAGNRGETETDARQEGTESDARQETDAGHEEPEPGASPAESTESAANDPEAGDPTTESDPADESVEMGDLLEESGDGDAEQDTMWDGSGFEPVEPSNDDPEGSGSPFEDGEGTADGDASGDDEAASDGGTAIGGDSTSDRSDDAATDDSDDDRPSGAGG